MWTMKAIRIKYYLHLIHRILEETFVILLKIWVQFMVIFCGSSFFTGDILENMVFCTNTVGNLYLLNWGNTCADEMLAFISITIYMGMYIFPQRRMNWALGVKGSLWVRSVMTRDRFDMILKALHVRDYSLYTAEDIKAHKKADGFWPFAEFAEQIAARFRILYNPFQFLSLDEQTIGWKGAHPYRQYNKSKPQRWHLQLKVLADAATGYEIDFYCYRGSDEVRPPGLAATAYPAHQLTSNESLHNKGHILVTDNWFISLDQRRVLQPRAIGMIGTAKANRLGIPKEWQKNDDRVRKAYETTFFGETMYYTNWKNTQPVGILHTIPTYNGEVKRYVQERADV